MVVSEMCSQLCLETSGPSGAPNLGTGRQGSMCGDVFHRLCLLPLFVRKCWERIWANNRPWPVVVESLAYQLVNCRRRPFSWATMAKAMSRHASIAQVAQFQPSPCRQSLPYEIMAALNRLIIIRWAVGCGDLARQPVTWPRLGRLSSQPLSTAWLMPRFHDALHTCISVHKS